MKLIGRSTVQQVAERWKEQYYEKRGQKWEATISGPAEETYQKILKCATSDDVEAMLPGWTTHWCGVCKENKGILVRFEEPDYESISDICADCIVAAFLVVVDAYILRDQ